MSNILIISESLPFPPTAGAKAKNFNLIKRISHKHKISLITLIMSDEELQFVPEMKKYCPTIKTIRLKKYRRLRHLPGFIRRVFTGEPPGNRFYFMEEMKEKIRHLVTTHHFDIVQIEHSFMAPYINAIPKDIDCKKILVFHNVGSILYYRMFKTERRILKKVEFFFDWILSKRWEIKIAEKFDRCIVMSLLDKQILQSLNSKLNISVIPVGIDTTQRKPFALNFNSRNLLFVGGDLRYPPNLDGALYFYRKIFPIIKRRVRDVSLTIVGKNSQSLLLDLNSDKSVDITGYVKDINPYYQRCALAIVPLRAGGGIRLKILEAMALGRAVVSTSIGAEGLNVVSGRNIFIADEPEDFAECVIRLLTDRRLQEKITKNARKLVEGQYNWDSIAENLSDLYEVLKKERNR